MRLIDLLLLIIVNSGTKKLQEYLEDESLIRFAINMTYTYKNEKIKNDDEIALFPPVSGG